MKNEILLNALKAFLNEPEIKTIIENCKMPKKNEFMIGGQLRIDLSVYNEKIDVTISNNGNGFREFRKEFKI